MFTHLLLALLAATAPLVAPRVIGFSLDIEPPAGNESVAFVNVMAEYRWRLAGTGLRLSADAGTAWTAPEYETTVNGTMRTLAQWLVVLCDEAILMVYDRNATNLLVRAEPYLTYADGLSGKLITVGVAIATPGSPPTWWQTANTSELEDLIATVDEPLRQHVSFTARYAVFFGATLANASAAERSPPPTINETKTLWYLDDDWVYDAAAQKAFFNFAAAQNIVEVYDAPHAGSRPHIGANAVDQAAYAEFIKIAHGRGIDVQFLSGLATLAGDLEFIQTVNAELSR